VGKALDTIKKNRRAKGKRGEECMEVSRRRMMEPLYRRVPNQAVMRVTLLGKIVVTVVTVYEMAAQPH